MPALRDGGALLVLADQAERRTLLGADGVAAALAAGDGDDAGPRAVALAPLAEHRQPSGLVVGVRADVEDVEVGGLRCCRCVGAAPVSARRGGATGAARPSPRPHEGGATARAYGSAVRRRTSTPVGRGHVRSGVSD